MRTTLNIDDDLLNRARERAAKTHRTLTAVLEDALRQALIGADREGPRQRVSLKVSDQEAGLCPGVDLDSSSALLDLMERGLGPS